jgi:hypothetical protein
MMNKLYRACFVAAVTIVLATNGFADEFPSADKTCGHNGNVHPTLDRSCENHHVARSRLLFHDFG